MSGFKLSMLFFAFVVGSLGGTPFLPDETLNVTQMIQRRGYPVEQHYASTADGFVLSMQRIPRPGAQPVFLLHGFLDCSTTWVINEPYESLGYILYDNGFDVW
jgi:lysosomal acid lipase/cholesteryl ester hydrolase